MKSFFRSFFACMLAVLVFVLVIFSIVAVKSGQKSKIDDHSYLVVDIYGELPEYDPPAGVIGELMGGKAETLQRILSNMDKVCVDDRIDGVILKLSSSSSFGGAKMQEIRGAIKKVREAGKKVYGFADSMDRKTCFLAAACDSVYMVPTGYFSFTGFAAVTEHLKGTLDKLGIKPNLHKIKDYKSAAEMIMREDMSAAARENKEWLLDEFWELLITGLESDRGLSEEDVIDMMKLAVFTPEEAVEGGLIDRKLYWEELADMLKGDDDEDLRTVSQCRYADEDPEKLGIKGKKKIAVIHAQGMIGGRKNKVDPMFGLIMGHESINAEFKRAREDDDVAAIVFRIDSGGGDALTSDIIGHEVEITASEKPVVASMVDVAASGGYHIAYRASRIIADPMTITGSIGSISMKFNMRGFLNKLGITNDFATKGPMALFFSSYRDFTEEERKRFEDDHWNGFNSWLEDVAEHRGMTFEEAEKLAHGRVWSGRQGAENGLVDEMGGLDRAIELARELAEIPAGDGVTVVHYPAKKGLLEAITGGEGGLTAAAHYVVYRLIRGDIAETWNMVTESRMYMMEDFSIE